MNQTPSTSMDLAKTIKLLLEDLGWEVTHMSEGLVDMPALTAINPMDRRLFRVIV